MYHLIDIEKCNNTINISKTSTELYTYARYNYDRFLTKDRKTVLNTLQNEFGKVISPHFIKSAEPLIHLLHSFNIKLGISVFNTESVQQEMFFLSPPEVKKGEVPNELLKDFQLPYWILPPMRTPNDEKR